MASSDRDFIATVTAGLTLKTVDQLKKLQKILPVKEKPTRKAELVRQISSYLTGKNLRNIWKELNELQQSAVAEAVHVTEGIYQELQFIAKYGDAPEWSTRGTFYRYSSYDTPPAILDLFFYNTSSYGHGDIMPEDLRSELKYFVPKPKKISLTGAKELPQMVPIERYYYDYQLRKSMKMREEVPVVCCQTERTAQQDLLSILRFVHLGKVSVSDKTLMPSKSTVKQIAALLQGGDYYREVDSQPEGEYQEPIGPMKSFAWPMILQGAGLAKLTGKKLQLTNAGQKALNSDPANTIKAIWKKWLKTTVLDELRRVEKIKGQTGKGKHGLTALDRRRSVISDLLMDCPVEIWILFDDLKRYTIATDQTFKVSRYPENLYICESGYGNLYDARGSWSILETSYMRCLLFEYAATLGLLDVAYISPYDAPSHEWSDYWGTDDFDFLSRYDGLYAIKLTPLGAFCLGLEASYTASAIKTETSLRVLPNLDIVMAGSPLTPGEMLMMETFTVKTSDAVWKLDRDAILKATADGHSLEDFQDFLSEASVEKFPDTVKHFFQDCVTRCNSLQDKGLVKLIECTDATLANLIAHDSRTKKYCKLAGERDLLVPIADETRFRNALRKLGYILPLSLN